MADWCGKLVGSVDVNEIARNASMSLSNASALVKTINDFKKELSHVIDIDFGLLDELRSGNILSKDQVEEIKAKPTVTAKVCHMLEYLKSLSDAQVEIFLTALTETQQEHVVKYVRANGSLSELNRNDWPLIKCYEEMTLFSQNRCKVIDVMDTKNGLLDELFAAHCINHRQKEHIETAKTSAKENEEVLLVVERKNLAVLSGFIDCLVKTKQQHVVSLLSETRGVGQPLNSKQRSRLEVNHAVLVKLLDSENSLLAKLLSAQVITWRHKESIESGSSPSDRNSRLLEIIRKGSEENYCKFIECLNSTGRRHVGRLLSEVGVVAHFIAHNNQSDNMKNYERVTVNRLMSFLQHGPVENREYLCDKVNEILAGLTQHEVELIAVNSQDSIGLFFLCKTSAGLLCISELYAFKKLKSMAEDLFNLVLRNNGILTVENLRWDVKNYSNCVQYFRPCDSLKLFENGQCSPAAAVPVRCNQRLLDLSRLSIECPRDKELLLKLLIKSAVDMLNRTSFSCPYPLAIKILQSKSAGQLLKNISKTSDLLAGPTASLMAVSEGWWMMIKERKVKRLLRRYFKNVILRNTINHMHINSMRWYLQQAVDIDFGLLDELLSLGILSNEQLRIVRSVQDVEGRINQMLHYVDHSNVRRFFKALENTQQSHIIEYIQKNRELDSIRDDYWPVHECTPKMKLISYHWSEVVSSLDCHSEFLEQLVDEGCISSLARQHIEAIWSHLQKSEELMEMMKRRSVASYEKFLRCLIAAKQYRVADLLGCKTVPLLPYKYRNNLKANRAALVELLDITQDKMTYLLAADCITAGQLNSLKGAATRAQTNQLLLGMLSRGCESDFFKSVDCLRPALPDSVIDVLLRGGVIVRLKSVDAFLQLSYVSENSDDFTFILALTRTCDCEKQSYTDLFFQCSSLAQLWHMIELYHSDELKVVLKVENLSWNMSEYYSAMKYLCSTSGLPLFAQMYQLACHSSLVNEVNTLQSFLLLDMPFEVVEIIVVQSALHLYDRLRRTTHRPVVQTLLTLCGTSGILWRLITYRRFTIRQLKRAFRKSAFPYKVEINKAHVLPTKKTAQVVSGLAETDGNLYVVHDRSNMIYVYNVRRGQPDRLGADFSVIKVTDLYNPTDLIVCDNPKRLYVADCSMKCVRLVELSARTQRFIKTKFEPRSLSATEDGLLITSGNGDAIHDYRITEDDGIWVRIGMPDHMRARHAIKTTYDTFIVCHEARHDTNQRWSRRDADGGVAEFNSDGDIVRSYRHEGMQAEMLGRPVCTVIDSFGNMLVTDTKKDNICVLNPDLTLQRVLVSPRKGHLVKMAFSERTGRLFVAFQHKSVIPIYTVLGKGARKKSMISYETMQGNVLSPSISRRVRKFENEISDYDETFEFSKLQRLLGEEKDEYESDLKDDHSLPVNDELDEETDNLKLKLEMRSDFSSKQQVIRNFDSPPNRIELANRARKLGLPLSSCLFKDNLIKIYLNSDCPRDILTMDTKNLLSQLEISPSFEVQLCKLDGEESLEYTASVGLNPGVPVGTQKELCTLGLFLSNKDDDTGTTNVYAVTPGHCCNEQDIIYVYADGKPSIAIGTVEKKVVSDCPPTVDIALVNLDLSVCDNVRNLVLIDNVNVRLSDGIAHDRNGMTVQKFRTGPAEPGTVCHRVVGVPQSGEFVDCISVIHRNGEQFKFHVSGESGCLVTTEPKLFHFGENIACGVAILIALETLPVNGHEEYFSLARPPPLTVLRGDHRFASLCVHTSSPLTDSDTCTICKNNQRDHVATVPCGHVLFCKACLDRIIKDTCRPTCPYCRREILFTMELHA